MMKLRKLLGILQIAALLLLVYQPHRAYACSCEGPDPSLSEVEQVQASLGESYHKRAFVGTVTSVYRTEVSEDEYNEDPVYVTFAVEHVLKGELAAEVVITTPPDDGLCGANFVVGVTYLTYTYSNWSSELCSWNIPAPSAELIASLETAPPNESGERGVELPSSVESTQSPATEVETMSPDGGRNVALPIVGVTLLGVVIGLAVAWLMRARN